LAIFDLKSEFSTSGIIPRIMVYSNIETIVNGHHTRVKWIRLSQVEILEVAAPVDPQVVRVLEDVRMRSEGQG
jgi:hypothetical protein